MAKSFTSRNRKKRIFNKYFSTHEKNISTVIIFEAGDTQATVLNLPLSKAEITARLSGFSFVSDVSGAVPATCKESESPCFLTLSPEQQAVFDRAIKAGLMERLSDGRYHWLTSKSLLSYFCGRVFCGDYAQDSVWQCGKGRLPVTLVERLFGVGNIGRYRRNRVLLRAPKNHAVVDAVWL